MQRRQARLRREYLFKRQQEAQERGKEARKDRLRQALEQGKTVPTELRSEYEELKRAIDLDDARTQGSSARQALDDEYARAGIEDPRVLITTSRDPSSRLVSFAKELKLVFPNAHRVNRGSSVMRDMVRACHKHDYTDLVIVHEHRGEPDGLIVSHMPHGPTAYFGLSGAVLRHDIAQSEDIDLGPVSEQYPHLIMENFSTPLGRRVRDVLRFLFPVPKPDSRRVMTFANTDDFISFRHHVYRKVGGGDVELTEVGPRFEMRLYQLKLGTVDQPEADNEWVLRPYMNTSSKRKALGE